MLRKIGAGAIALSIVIRQKIAAHFVLIIAYLAFIIILGVPEGLLGVGWPSIRDTFGLANDAVGVLLTAGTLGYMLASSNSGSIIARLGVGRALTAGAFLRSIALFGYAISPIWPVMISLGFVTGLGSGTIDAGLNTYVAANYSARYMNWLHASYGIGATLGPLVMTAVLNTGASWRWGYAMVGALQVGMALVVALTRKQWRTTTQSAEVESAPPIKPASALNTLRRPMVWLGIILLFTAAGIEWVAGQWAYTLLAEGRGVAEDVAGLWTSIYWGSFTIARILAGVVVARIGSIALLRTSMVGVIVGAALIGLNSGSPLSFLGLAAMGFSIAPVFPLLISCTPARVGLEHAANAIGFQIGAAGLGIAILPGLAGVLATQLDNLEVIGPYMTAIAIALFLLHEFTLLRERSAQLQAVDI